MSSPGNPSSVSAPMALATKAAHRIVLWPRYDSPADMQALAREVAPTLAGRNDVCLCLRHDGALDVPIEQAVAALERAFAGGVDVEVLLVDDPMDHSGWVALGQAVTAAFALPSSDPARKARLQSLGRPILVSGAELRRHLDGAASVAPAVVPTEVIAPVVAAPAVTAIVSTYKSAVFMRGCLEDLVAQTLYRQGQLEIVVIDSGSPENEGDIVREMQQRHPGIRYLRTEREPLYTAWNRAIGMARGRYLTNANTDDRHRPDALEILAGRLDADQGVGVVYADCLITERPNESYAHNSARRRHSWPEFSYAELQRRCIVGPQPMWRKSLHERWGQFDERYVVAGDYEFWMRIGNSERFEHLPEALGLYFENRAGLEHASGRTMDETREIQRRYAPAPAPVAVAPVAAAPPARKRSGDPTVSVIMPTYNRPDFLARALLSLVDQTFQDFEVVLVNDAGASLEPLLGQFEGKLDITYIRHGVNRDRAAARNTGLGAARGRFIAYLDDDDCYRPDHLETLVQPLLTGAYKVACSDSLLMLETKTASGYQPVKSLLRRSSAFDRDRLMVANYIPVLSVMHERSCLTEVGRFDETLGTHEDWELFIRLACRYEFFHIPKVTADVSYRPDGTSTTSAKGGDFARTMALIHQRYAGLVKHRPDLLSRQAEALHKMRGETPAPAPNGELANWPAANGVAEH